MNITTTVKAKDLLTEDSAKQMLHKALIYLKQLTSGGSMNLKDDKNLSGRILFWDETRKEFESLSTGGSLSLNE